MTKLEELENAVKIAEQKLDEVTQEWYKAHQKWIDAEQNLADYKENRGEDE